MYSGPLHMGCCCCRLLQDKIKVLCELYGTRVALDLATEAVTLSKILGAGGARLNGHFKA